MSCCRMSDESDVYVYAHVCGHWQIHVVNGEAFQEATPKACADRLRILAAKGFRVPGSALERLDGEVSHES